MGILFVLMIPVSAVSGETNAISTSHSPQDPQVGQVIDVFLNVNDTTNISQISLLYCQIEPLYLCYTPSIEMVLLDNDTYTASITRDLSGITKIGYNITISYDDDSIEYSPVGTTYHYVNITGGETAPTPCPSDNLLGIQILLVVLIVIIIYMVVKHQKDKKSNKPQDKKLFSILTVIIIILAASAGILFVLGQDSGDIKEAPDFTLTDIDGNTFNLTDFQGKVVLLDMMSIPCESCKIVEKDLKNIYPEYEDDVIFISIDILADDTDEMLQDYRESHDIDWIIARDTDEVILKYNSQAIPKVVIINKDGFATFENQGLTNKDTLRNELDRAVSGQATAIAITQASIFGLAIFAGIASFFSPCAFPMLPGYIAYYLKKDVEAGGEIPMRKAAMSGAISAAGIIIVYLIIGLLMVVAGSSIASYTAIFTLIIGIVLIALGILLFTPLQYWKIVRPFQNLFARVKGMSKKKAEGVDGGETAVQATSSTQSGFYSGLFLYGLGYGAAAAGCTAPLFIAVVLAAMAIGSLFMGIVILLLYTITAALLMLGVTMAIAYFGAGAAQKLSKHTETIKKISGVVLVLGGIYLIWFFFAAA
jgi:cytochrome c-type biogenesis protein